MAYEFRTERMVEFAETDMAGILHFSNYFRYMEMAEHAFFRSLGLSVHKKYPNGAHGAARRTANCDYRQPLRYEDVVELHVIVKEKRRRSITYVVVFRNKETGAETARGEMAVVFVGGPDTGEGLCAMPIPPEVDACIDVAPPELWS